MAYLKPNWFTKNVFNRIARATGVSGTETLAVRRRKSGGEQVVPVIPVDYGGARYVVSPRGETDWVRNARAAGELELRGKGGAQRFRTVEVPLEGRGEIIPAYREKAGRAIDGYWRKLPDDADHPVFRLEPV
jgi:hypothetical protein